MKQSPLSLRVFSLQKVSTALAIVSIAFVFTTFMPTAAFAAPTIDSMLTSLLTSIDAPLRGLLGIVCYVLAIALVMRGLLRIPKHAERHGSQISIPGTIMSLVVGGVLITLPSHLDLFSQSLFGSDSYSYASFGSNTAESEGRKAAQQIIKVVLRFIQIGGLIWFISAWFNLLDASDGKRGKTFSGGIFRLFAATACWNIFSVISVVQNTLKIDILEIT
ncbi:hypothetical protein [Kiloniella sp.]|uniref:hypothetical protein n=1 Tax=Kiloniella sp. TaxID=1938587 RepID=UPI003B02DB70